MKNDDIKKCSFPVEGMMCTVCAGTVESTAAGVPGVIKASVNFASMSLTVEWDASETSAQAIADAIKSVGFEMIVADDVSASIAEQEMREMSQYKSLRKKVWVAWGMTLPVAVIGMAHLNDIKLNVLSLILTLIVMLYCGRHFYLSGFKQAYRGNPNMDTLVAVSTFVSFIYSVVNTFYSDYLHETSAVYYEAAAMIITFVLTGKLMESRVRRTTGNSIRQLMQMQPSTAMRLLPNGKLEEVDVTVLGIGDKVVIRPGERVSVDGVVESGVSSVDESIITGESMPVEKSEGSKVSAGTINGAVGTLIVKVEKRSTETLLSQIIAKVRDAQGSKAPVQRIVDKVSRWFVPAIVGISIITFVVWILVGAELSFALMTAVSVLVIACPCALGLATPTAIVVGIGQGAKHHILIKDAVALEQMNRIDVVAVDKTGTLTEGRPKVVNVGWLTEKNEEVLTAVVSLENHSEHPLANAIVDWAETEAIIPVKVDSFDNISGKGIVGAVANKKYWVGSLKLTDAKLSNADAELISAMQAKGSGVVFAGVENRVMMWFEIADSLKFSAKDAVDMLKLMGKEVVLLTGDDERTSRNIADKVGIETVMSEMLPADKENFIRKYQQEGRRIAMVGDGVNDSQALSAADVSIAMSTGSDIAMDVAQITIIGSDLMSLPKAVELSEQTVKLIKQNLFWAFIYNVVGVPIAAGVLYPVSGVLLTPMIASAAMAISSLCVVGNSLRLSVSK